MHYYCKKKGVHTFWSSKRNTTSQKWDRGVGVINFYDFIQKILFLMDDFPKTSTYIIIFPYLQLDLLRGQLVSSMWSKHNEDILWMSCSKTVDLHTLDKKELLIHRQQKKSQIKTDNLKTNKQHILAVHNTNIKTVVNLSVWRNNQIWWQQNIFVKIKQSSSSLPKV